jgi:hypothetical protein
MTRKRLIHVPFELAKCARVIFGNFSDHAEHMARVVILVFGSSDNSNETSPAISAMRGPAARSEGAHVHEEEQDERRLGDGDAQGYDVIRPAEAVHWGALRLVAAFRTRAAIHLRDQLQSFLSPLGAVAHEDAGARRAVALDRGDTPDLQLRSQRFQHVDG